jgi:hypothetical protein
MYIIVAGGFAVVALWLGTSICVFRPFSVSLSKEENSLAG